MANLSEYKIYREPQGNNGFIGYDNTLPPEQLPKGYLADAVNCFCGTGAITRRNGTTLIGNDLGASGCQGLKGVKFADGTKEMLGIFNGVIYKWTGTGDWSALTGSYALNTSGLIDIVVANDSVYFFDGTNEVPKYNGTTTSTVAGIPIGKYAKWYHNQLHVGNIASYPSRLQSSVIGDPETFEGGTSSSIDVNPNDGNEIVGLKELDDRLNISKNNRVWSLTGFGSSALSLDNLNEQLSGFGTISNWSMVNTGNDILYIGMLKDLPIIRSLKRTQYGTLYDAGIISKNIEDTMRGLNATKLTGAAAAFDGRYAWFAVPNGSSAYNNLILTYDTIKKGWTRHTGLNPSCFEFFTISATPELFFGEASADSKAYKFSSATSDNGVAIDFSVKTRRYGAEFPEFKKKYKWLFVHAEESGDYDITIQYSPDGFTFDTLGTLNLTGTGSIFDGVILDQSRFGTTDINRERLTIPKSRAYYIQFQFTNSSTDAEIVLRNWELYFLLRTPVDI